MKIGRIKLDIMYHIGFLGVVVYLFLMYRNAQNLLIIPAIIWIVLLLFDYIMLTIIGVRTQIDQLIVWTFRLSQIQILSLIDQVRLPIIVHYLLLIGLLNILFLCISSLLTQFIDMSLLKQRLLIGSITIVGLWTNYTHWIVLGYVGYIVISSFVSIKNRINYFTYMKKDHIGYWLLVSLFAIQLVPWLGIVILSIYKYFVFTQLWWFFITLMNVLLMLIAGFDQKSMIRYGQKWLGLIFSLLLCIYLFILVIDVPLWIVIFILYSVGSIQYILLLIRSSENRDINTLVLIKKEEALKQDFSNYLHDDVLQDINVLIKMTTLEPSEKTQAFLREQLSALNDQLRQQMNQYSPQLSKHLTLQENYRLLVRSLEQTYPNQAVSTSFSMNRNLTLPEPYDVLVYRWLRELIHNVYKHAGANQLDIHVAAYDELIIVLVEDDGCFKKGSHLKIGHGLYVIQEQVEAIGGQLYIEANRPRGLRMRVEFSVMGGETIEDFVGR